MKNVSLNSSRSWGIAVVCSFINFLHLGIARQSGLLYLAAISRFNANRNQASLPFVLCYTVRNVSGPLIGYLGRKVGLETITIIGCIVASIGMGACFFAEDIFTVIVLWGGVFGLGFGMGSVLIPVILNQHFDKYLSNANGIAFGGECVAGFVLPVLVKYVLDEYGTSGLFLILSSLMLHSIPAAMLLKATSKPSTTITKKPIAFYPNKDDITLSSGIAGFYNKSFDSEDSGLPQANLSIPMYNIDLKIVQELDITNENKSINHKNSDSIQSQQEQNSQKVTVIRYPKEDSDYSLDYKLNLKEGTMGNLHSNGNVKNSQLESPKSAIYSFSVFYDPAFILMLLTQSTFIFISTMILTIIVDYSRDVGVTNEQEMYILMCLSISDMIGRFGLGWVTDSGLMSNVAFSSLCFFCMGIIMVALVFIKGFTLVMIAAFFIGLFLGGFLIVCPGIVSDYIDKDKVTMALASRFVFYAPMSLTQSSLIGFFRGTKGSYNGILYMLSVICLLCCIMSLSIPHTVRFRDKRRTIIKSQSVENS
ncbi:uncharacterized protein NPIL_259971 [Nephila pilipes]|uniref:Monocarboxylate transporter n=1 Tax=Nephila pilipes TaxID=299642 RepID=A0A8X6JEX4_NEPPI|nr:uncharacterized protein NPIL_259971 [Nephila pilipes]